MPKLEFKEYQKLAIDFAFNRDEGCYLPLKMGYGKTLISLEIISKLILDCAVTKILIVAPIRVAYLTWPLEIEKWDRFKHLTYHKIHHNDPYRRERNLFKSKARIFMINYEKLPWLEHCFKRLLTKPFFDMVVFDESTKLKNSTTSRFKSSVRMFQNVKYNMCLSGTPRPNNITELWAQLYLIDKGKRLETNFRNFCSRYARKDWFGNLKIPKHREKQIYDKIEDLFFKIPEHLKPKEIPHSIINIEVTLPEKIKAEYRLLEKSAFMDVGLDDLFKVEAVAVKLRQFAAGIVYTQTDKVDGERPTLIKHTRKFESLKKLMDTHKRALIFYGFLSERDYLVKNFDNVVALSKSGKEIEQWNNREIDFLALHPLSAGHGLNLQGGGHTLIWLSLPYSLEQYLQANARLVRTGQKEKVNIFQLVIPGTIDDLLIEVLRERDHSSKRMEAIFSSYVKERGITC